MKRVRWWAVCVVFLAGCGGAMNSKKSATPVESLDREAALSQTEALVAQIEVRSRQQGWLPPPPQSPELSPTPRAGVDHPNVLSSDEAESGSDCELACEASEAICVSSERICQIAAHFAKDKLLEERCQWASQQCSQGQAACQRCE